MVATAFLWRLAMTLAPVCGIYSFGMNVENHQAPLKLHGSTHFERILRGDVIRYKAEVAYDGTDFHGFQLQRSGSRTVQRELEDVMKNRFQRRIQVIGASRTDSGVHARGQVVHFDVPTCIPSSPRDDPKSIALLRNYMNRTLSKDVRIRSLAVAPSPSPDQIRERLPWDANVNAVGKLYTYSMSITETLNPIDARCRASFPPRLYPVNLKELESTLSIFVGTKNFRGFCSKAEKTEEKLAASGLDVRNTVRSIHSIQMTADTFRQSDYDTSGSMYLDFEIVLNGALYKMIRNILGASLAVACGKLDMSKVRKALDTGFWECGSKYRCKAPPVPAKGLVLQKVFYNEFKQ